MAKKIVPEKTGMELAVEAAGTQDAMAQELGVTQQSISVWLKQGFAPIERAREIEMHYGVPRAKLVSPKVLAAMDSGVDL